MYIWISGGGTGGHVYPALTVLEASGAEATVRWLGRPGSFEAALVRERGLPFLAIDAAPMVGQGLLGRLRGALRLLGGTAEAWRAAGRERPDAVLVTGGYVSVPVAFAAWLRHIPLAIYLPDVIPGKAVRLIARLADRIAVTDAAAAAHLPAGKCVVTGYPVRERIRHADRRASHEALGIHSQDPVLLVFGGSQGARSLNQALCEAAPTLLPRYEIVHVCGPLNYELTLSALSGLPEPLRERHHLHAYLHDADMAAAFAAADLAICRAGASTLGELPARGLPGLLIPLPISGGHQWPNARVLEAAGAAVTLEDAALSGPRLASEVEGILQSPARLAEMREAARSLDKPDAPAAIWRLVLGLAEEAAA